MTGINVNDGTVPFTDEPHGPVGASTESTLIASGTAAGLLAPPMSYAWTRDGRTIPGATGRAYVSDALLDAYSLVQPTITDRRGLKATPAAFYLVPRARAARFTIALEGPARVGQPCTFTAEGDMGQPHVRFEPRWTVGGVPVGEGHVSGSGVSNLFYRFRPADEGKAWTLTVDGVNASGTVSSNTLSGTVGAAGTLVPSGVRDPQLAIGSNDWEDYNAEFPTLDWAKFARVEFAPNSGSDRMKIDDARRGGHLDAQGYPLDGAIPAGYDRFQFGWAPGDAAYTQSLNPFVVTWEGQATLTLGNMVQVSSGANTRTVNLDGGNCQLIFTGMGSGANRLRNVRMIPQRFLALHQAGEIFNPDFLDTVMRNKRIVRFLGWNKANVNDAVTVADVTPFDYVTWTTNYGAPLKVQTDLCNRIRADAWAFVPFPASDALAVHIATHYRDHLHPDLCCYTEFSNELWNVGIGHHTIDGERKTSWQHADAFGKVKFAGTRTMTNQWGWANQWYGMRVKTVAKIFNDVYAGQPKRRWCNTLNCQTVGSGPFTAREILDTIAWAELFPDEFIPGSVIDALACTTYVGSHTGTHQVNGRYIYRDQIDAAYDPNTDASDRLIRDWLFDPAMPGSVPAVRKTLTEFRQHCDQLGMDLLIYEGGFHILMAAGARETWTQNVTDAVVRFADSPQGLEVIAALFDVTMAVTDGPAMHLTTIGPPSYYGDWHLYMPGFKPRLHGRLMESMAMTRKHARLPAVTDDRYLRPGA